jgi:hypothetical protein
MTTTYDISTFTTNTNADQPSWLDAHDREYNHTTNNYHHPQATTASKNHHPLAQQQQQQQQQQQLVENSQVPAMDPEMQERLETMMKERYGLELPKLNIASPAPPPSPQVAAAASHHAPQAATATGGHQDPLFSQDALNYNGSSHTSAPPTSSRRMPVEPPTTTTATTVPTTTAAEASPPHFDHGSIPQSLLEQMPPQIREVAIRRPDLVQDLLQAKTRQPLLRPHPEEQEDVQITATTTSEGAAQDWPEEDETTSLIQRKRRPKYKSMEQ